MQDFFCVSYSRSQTAYHIESVGDSLRHGLAAWSSQHSGDFLPIAMFADEGQARGFVQSLMSSSGHLSVLKAKVKDQR